MKCEDSKEEIFDMAAYAEAILATIRAPLLVLDSQLRVKSANKAFYKTFCVTESETGGELVYNLGNNQWNIPELRRLLEDILPKETSFDDFEVSVSFPHIGERVMQLNAREITGQGLAEKSILLAIEDVTEKVASRKHIEESNERYHSMLINSPFAFSIMKGKNLEITLANPLMKEIWGKGDHVEGKTLLQVLPEIKDQGFPEMIDTVYTTGKPVSVYEILASFNYSGEIADRYFNIVYYPFFEPDETVSGVVTIATEVTIQVLARKKIEESEHRYHNMIYNSPSLIAIFKGADMIVENANDAILESWGKGKDIIGKSLFEVMPETADQGFFKLLLNVYTTGEPVYAYEKPVALIRNGESQLMHYTFVYQAQRDVTGKIEGVAVLANEVTEQVLAKKKIEESENHFRHLADLMPAKIINATADGEVTYFNQQWLDFSGLTLSELKEFGYHKMMHPDEVPEFRKRFETAALTKTVLEMEMRFLNKEGEYKWHLNLASPITDENGEIKMWIGSTTDIQKLKDEEKRKADFVTMLSHELKTPITSIKGYVQLVLQMITKTQEIRFPPLLKPSLARIDQLISKLTGLITDMLDLTRINSNQIELKLELANMNDLVTGIVEDMRNTSTRHAISLDYDRSYNLLLDKDKIGQVLVNFISNAIKYSPEGEKIEVRISGAENNQVAVSVKDYGIGIDPKEHQKVFERFYRVEDKTEHYFSGFGIGLFIAHSIIMRHNGTITVDSEKGKGSVFTFLLPF